MNREVKNLLLDIIVLDSEQEKAPSLGDMAKRARMLLDRYNAGRARRAAKSLPRRKEETKERDERNAKMGGIREAVMARSHGSCELCRNGKVHEVHHIIGGPLRRRREAADTCIGLCLECHRSVHDNDWPTMVNLELWVKTNGSQEAREHIERRVSKLARLRSEP